MVVQAYLYQEFRGLDILKSHKVDLEVRIKIFFLIFHHLISPLASPKKPVLDYQAIGYQARSLGIVTFLESCRKSASGTVPTTVEDPWLILSNVCLSANFRIPMSSAKGTLTDEPT